MVAAKNAMEVFSLLDKSNCRQCGEKTCLAFAGSVYMGNRRIQECPNLSSADILKFSKETVTLNSSEDNQDEYVSSLLHEIVSLDLR